MRESYREILELLRASELALTPANISYNSEISHSYVRKECLALFDKGLVERDADDTKPFYKINDRGLIALEQDKLEVECTYHGFIDDGSWIVEIAPLGRLLADAGDEYHKTSHISWGKHGGDGGAFNLAEDLLRHAVGEEAASDYAFGFYKKKTKQLPQEFKLTGTEIRKWVNDQEQDTQEESATGSDSDGTEDSSVAVSDTE